MSLNLADGRRGTVGEGQRWWTVRNDKEEEPVEAFFESLWCEEAEYVPFFFGFVSGRVPLCV